MRKFNVVALCIVLLLMFTSNIPIQAGSSTWTESKQVSYSGGQKTVTVLWVDLNNDQVRLEAAFAGDGVGNTAPLKNIVEGVNDADGKGIAGINGTFFNAYADMQPAGTVIEAGEVKHISNTGSVMAITDTNAVRIDPLYAKVLGGTNDQWNWPYSWYAWNINHYYNDPSATMIFTGDYEGPKPAHDFTSIEVKKGLVQKITRGSFHIPADGFIVLTKDQNVIDVFSVGEKAEYRVDYYRNNYTSLNDQSITLDYSKVRTAIGAGPHLVKNGQVVANASSEGFSEDKITQGAAMRSLVGVTADGILGMATVSGVNVVQLGEIAKELGMIEAMNLDGGGSSALYHNGKYISAPGRNISNALVVKELYHPPVSVELNNNPIFFDSEPYNNPTYGRVLVPLRKIAEALGANVGWDPATSSVSIERLGTQMLLKVDSNTVNVNGQNHTMDVPVTLRNNRTYVPVRFVTEFFDGRVEWDGITRTVKLTINDAREILDLAKAYEESGQLEPAIGKYQEVLSLDAKNITAAKRLADIFNRLLEKKEEAIPYYELVYSLDSEDSANINALAWLYYSTYQYDKAIELFEAYSRLNPTSGSGEYGIAQCYASYQMNDIDKAVDYFQYALSKNLNDTQKEYAVTYINKHN